MQSYLCLRHLRDIPLRSPHPSLSYFSTNFSVRCYSGYATNTVTSASYNHQRFYSDKNIRVSDFRSDTVTYPTDEMIDAMRMASRGDDLYNEDKTTKELEAYVAELTGHEAGLFAVSATMANQLAIRTHLTRPPHSVLLDFHSHIYKYEAGGLASHSQALAIPINPLNKSHLTAQEIKSNLISSDDIHHAPTHLVCLENTLDGVIFPFSEIVQISRIARERGVKLHLDGARLWNASAEKEISLKQYGQYFDSITLCLSKSIGAPIGSILVGDQKFIDKARHFRKQFGGGWRQSGLLAAAANFAIRKSYPDLIKETHTLARHLANGLQSHGILILKPVDTNMVFIDVKPINLSITRLMTKLMEHDILIENSPGTITRLVLHYQITREAIDKFLWIVGELITE
ncbi:8626_t:CDS:2 [Ambispora leptoticha]|uniref:8626_t:CDS:1 n=1 Tax=Ambispora leptoticha TaxID=144679 RepID=A0A9N8YUA9_9GLOM|nr:8626_t:CDS:2 [Ambispora leptoticha]